MFITLNVQYTALRRQYNQCVYEQDTVSREYEKVTHQLGQITAAAGDSTSYKSSETYQKLQAYSTTMENRKDFLDTKISLLKGQMESYQKAASNNMQNDTKLWCFA